MKRKLSESTERLIEALYEKRGLANRLFHPDSTAKLIQQIEEADEPEAIPDLLPILIVGNRDSIVASAKAIHHLVQRINPADYVRFDEFVRPSYANWSARREPWYSMKPDVDHLSAMGEFSTSLLGIASFHSNGRVREAAVLRLGKMETGAELPFLLIRANDWVSQIRSLVRALLQKRIQPAYASHLSAWLPLLLRLARAGRDDHSPIIEAVRRLFNSPELHQVLRDGFESRDGMTRRFCFEVALNSNDVQGMAVLQRALDQYDPQVRMAAVRKLRAIAPNGESKELLIRARHDGYMPVRREALHILSERYPAEANQEFQSALIDANIAIREEAQHYFRRESTIDSRAHYSQLLETSRGRLLCAVIAGLGETGLPKDSELLARFVTDDSSKTRAAAIHAIAKLNADAYVDEFVKALDDTSSKVTREAVIALSKKANAVGGQRLWKVYEQSRNENGKRGVLFLLARINKWDSLTFLIRSLADQEDSIVTLSRRYIVRWFARYNRSFVTPTQEQIFNLKTVLSEYNLLLASETRRQLDSLLKNF